MKQKILEHFKIEKSRYGTKVIKDKMWDVFDEKFLQATNDLENFRINGLTCGIEIGLLQSDRDKSMGIISEREYDNINRDSVIKRYNNLCSLIRDKEFINKNIECEIGNPKHTSYQNLKLNICDLFHIYDLWQITRLINFSKVKYTLEIGGGFGMLANKILNNHQTKYISIDLPETLILQHYYLAHTQPNLKIIREQDIKGRSLESLDFDILLITPFHSKEILDDIKLDLVINCRGFSEMNKETLKEYFSIIQNNINDEGYIYLGSERYMAYRGVEPVGIRDYPFDNFWTPIISQPSWLVSQGHDFLLKRNKNPYVPFQEIIKSFPICTPPPSPITKDYDIKSWLTNNKVPESHIF